MRPPEPFERGFVTAEEQQSLYAEQVKQLYSNALVGLLASVINSLVLAFIQRDVTSRAVLITWVASLTAINLLRYSDIRAFWRRSPEASETDHWSRRFIVGLVLSGMAWGSSAILLFPVESLAHQTFLAFVIGGMVAGAAAAFSSITKAFLAYSVPALGPIIVRFALLEDEFHLAMAGMTLLFGVMMFSVAKRINAVRITSLKLRFENSGLLSYLTERRRMEEALRESEEKYRNLVEQPLQGTFVIQDMRIVFANQAFADIGGYTIEELCSFSPEEVMNIIHPDDQKRIWGRYGERLEGKPLPSTYNEFRAFRKDGSIAWVEYAAVRINYGGRPAVQISIVDRTQRRDAEGALRESQSRLEAVFAAIPDPILEYDTSGRPVRANEAALKAAQLNSLDFARDQLIAKLKFTTLDGSVVRIEDLPTSRALRGEIVAGDLYSIRTADGLDRVISTYASPLLKDGKVNGAVGLWHDITELKRVDDALRKAHDELELRVEERTEELRKAYESLRIETEERQRAETGLRQAHKMEAVGTLAGGIAHDFNNILAAIIGFSEMAMDKTPDGSSARGYMERVFRAGLRGRELVKQILTFSRRAEQEKLPLKLVPVAKEAIGLLRASLPSTIEIRMNLPSESGFVLGDPTQIQQVLMNLCTNAAHAMRQGGGTISIDLTRFSLSTPEDAPDPTMTPGLYAKLSVTDTGEGMLPETIEHIFEPFFTAKAAGEGTGLGLSVVHGIVTSHGGTITVSSEPGKGSTFTIYLPKLPEEQSRDSAHEGGSIPLGHERILFVDDEKDLAAMGDDMLTALGYRVTSKTGPSEALALFRVDPSQFDLIITDQTMPTVTGRELVEEILAIRGDMPIIMCTGFSHSVDADTAKEAGIRAFVIKPLTKREIARTIRKVLDDQVQ